MGGTPRSARAALRVVLGVLACLAPPCAGAWAQQFRMAQSVEPPLVGAPPIVTEGPGRPVEPADPPTPTVRLRVRAPAAAASGQEVDYHILVENPSRAAANHVQVRVPLPANADFVRASPEPAAREPQFLWDFGTMPPATSKEVLLTLKPNGAQDVDVIARVQFEHGESVRTHIGAPPQPAVPMPPAAAMPPAPPMPAAPPMPPAPTPTARPVSPPPMPPATPKAELRLRKTGDQSHALVNDFIRFELEVANVGTADAKNVVIEDSLPPGLRYEPEVASAPVGNIIHWDFAVLTPGETRRVHYKALATAAGDQENAAVAKADGDLRVKASWLVHVSEPKLTVTMTGPGKKLVGSPAKYKITVVNAGTSVLTGVELFDDLPAGGRLVAASDNGRLEGNRVHWLLGDAPAGQGKSMTVVLTVEKAGESVNRATAKADRGVTAEPAEAKTLFETAAGIRMEIDKSDDPLPVGREADYTVRVSNHGSGPAKNLQLTVTAPEQMQVLGKYEATEATLAGQTLTFAPLLTLDAGKEATYKVHVKALKAGEIKVVAELKSDDLTTPLHQEETTTIAGEPPPMPASSP